MTGVAPRWSLAIGILVLADLLSAKVMMRMWPEAAMSRAERALQARLQQAGIERQYRIESPVYDHDLAKQFDGVAWWGPRRYRMTTDSLGFKDATPRIVPLKSTGRRVLLLGDSFTEGLGMEYRDTYAGLIAGQLGMSGTEVLNGAVTSYSPAIYFSKTRYLMDAGLEFSDAVVFIDISDMEDEARFYDLSNDGRVSRMIDQKPGRGGAFSDENSPAPLPVPRTLAAEGKMPRTVETPPLRQTPVAELPAEGAFAAFKRRSVVLSAADALYERFQYDASTDPLTYPQANARRGLWTIDERDYDAYGRLGLERASRHMYRLLTMLRAKGIGLTIAVYPWPDQLKYDTADSIQVKYWRTWAEALGAGFVDLFQPLFREADRDATLRRYYIAGDVHFNEEGSRLMASTFLASWR